MSSRGLAARVRDWILPTGSDLDVHVFGDVWAFFWFDPLLEFFSEGHAPLYSSTKSPWLANGSIGCLRRHLWKISRDKSGIGGKSDVKRHKAV